SYRYVEDPVRRSTLLPSRGLVVTLATASAALIAIPTLAARMQRDRVDYEAILDQNFGLAVECDIDGSVFQPSPKCQSNPTPTVMVWGDSFGMHIIPGIVASAAGAGVLQATRSRCGPLLGIAPIATVAATEFNRAWGNECMSFTRSV